MRSESAIKSYFYFGDTNENFKSNNGIIGNYKSSDSFWGCQFNEIIFKDISLPLKNEEGNLYQMYFATETHNIILPMRYIEIFKEITDNSCQNSIYNYLECKNMFDNSDYIPINYSMKI